MQVSWIPGVYFQYDFNHALAAFAPLFAIFLVQFFYCSTFSKVLAILIPVMQVAITPNGSLITSMVLSLYITASNAIILRVIS